MEILLKESIGNQIFGFCQALSLMEKKFVLLQTKKFFSTPQKGTFHQFLEQHATELIGDDWWLVQESKNNNEQSCLFK